MTTSSGAPRRASSRHVLEWLAGIGAVVAVFPILAAPFFDGTDTEPAIATLVLGAGWLVADRRRGSHGSVFAAIAAATCLASAVASATPNDAVLALTLVTIAGVAVLSDHRAGSAVAVLATTWAPVVAQGSTVTLVAVGIAGSLIVAEAAVRRSTAPGRRRASRRHRRAVGLAALPARPGARRHGGGRLHRSDR